MMFILNFLMLLPMNAPLYYNNKKNKTNNPLKLIKSKLKRANSLCKLYGPKNQKLKTNSNKDRLFNKYNGAKWEFHVAIIPAKIMQI